MKLSASIFALTLFIAASPMAVAQTESTDAPDQEATVEVETTTETVAEEAGTEAAAASPQVPGQIVLQSKDSFLASSLMDAAVLAPGEDGEDGEEEVGDVEDVIISFDGSVAGVVIAVGGFLGIGEKQVAVEMSALKMRVSPAGETVQIFLQTPKDQLEAAPAFKSVSHQHLEQERARAEAEMQQRAEETGALPQTQKDEVEQPVEATD